MIRKARVEDVKKIHQLINQSASRGEMLPRSLGELYDNLRDYFVHIQFFIFGLKLPRIFEEHCSQPPLF